jgi:protease-4
MSEVAGSGGYWISCLKAPVFAEPMTLTGSIGIIVLFASLRSFLRNLGITEDVIRTAPHADLGSPYRDLSKAEVQRIDDLIGKLYERFLNLVAEYREMTPGQVHERGEGRIYAGTEALEMGLISSVGGIDEAIESVRERLDAKRVRVRFYPRLKYSFAERILFSRRATAGPLSELASDVDTLFGLANAEPLAIVEDLFGSF